MAVLKTEKALRISQHFGCVCANAGQKKSRRGIASGLVKPWGVDLAQGKFGHLRQSIIFLFLAQKTGLLIAT